MSLDKAIKSGKEHRKEYLRSKAVDYSCRNHGTCKWCEDSRRIHTLREDEKFKYDIKDPQ